METAVHTPTLSTQFKPGPRSLLFAFFFLWQSSFCTILYSCIYIYDTYSTIHYKRNFLLFPLACKYTYVEKQNIVIYFPLPFRFGFHSILTKPLIVWYIYTLVYYIYCKIGWLVGLKNWPKCHTEMVTTTTVEKK